jgi:hypothetical protein
MKNKIALHWLVPLIAILAGITASFGLLARGGEGPRMFTTIYGNTVELYGRGVYLRDTTLVATLLKGTDFVTLFISLPLLIASYRSFRRGSWKGSLFLTGVLFYFLYLGATYTFSVIFNVLFLVYTGLFSASLFAVILLFTSLDKEKLAGAIINPGVPKRGIAIFMVVTGIATLLLWLSELVGPLATGSAPQNLGPYTTMFTHGFDSAVLTPALIISGVQIRKGKTSGYQLAIPLLILCAVIGITVISQTISQAMAGITFPVGVYIGMIGSWVVMGSFAVIFITKFFKHTAD